MFRPPRGPQLILETARADGHGRLVPRRDGTRGPALSARRSSFARPCCNRAIIAEAESFGTSPPTPALRAGSSNESVRLNGGDQAPQSRRRGRCWGAKAPRDRGGHRGWLRHWERSSHPGSARPPLRPASRTTGTPTAPARLRWQTAARSSRARATPRGRGPLQPDRVARVVDVPGDRRDRGLRASRPPAAQYGYESSSTAGTIRSVPAQGRWGSLW
jgi:hypothetical protein